MTCLAQNIVCDDSSSAVEAAAVVPDATVAVLPAAAVAVPPAAAVAIPPDAAAVLAPIPESTQSTVVKTTTNKADAAPGHTFSANFGFGGIPSFNFRLWPF